MALTNTQAQFNEVLTKRAIALLEDREDFAVISQKAVPMVPVTAYVGTYKKWKASDFRRRYIENRAAGTDFKRINLQLQDVAFACTQKGYEIPIDDRHAAMVEGALESVSSKQVEDGYAQFDIEFAAAMTTTNFTNYLTGVTSGSQSEGTSVVKWSDAANSKPIDDIMYAKTKIKNILGVYPDSLTISEDVFLKLKNNAQIIARMSSYTDKIVTVEKLKMFFELKNLFILKGSQTTTNEGQATQTAGLISSGQALLYFRGQGGPFDASTIQVFYNTNTYGAGSDGIIIQTYRDENKTSDISRIVQDFTFVVSMPEGGLLFNSIL